MSRLARLFVRGFLLESSYSPRYRQGSAAAWIVGSEQLPETDEPFNVNPVLAGYALGTLARGAKPKSQGPDRWAMAAAVSAVGDRLVWGLLRPLAVVASLLAAMAGAIPAAVTLLLVYNPPEFVLRWRSIGRGLEGDRAVLRDLSGAGLARLVGVLAKLGAAAVGLLGGFWLAGAIVSGTVLETAGLLCGVVASVLLIRNPRLGVWVPPLVALVLALLWLVVAHLAHGASLH